LTELRGWPQPPLRRTESKQRRSFPAAALAAPALARGVALLLVTHDRDIAATAATNALELGR
jgi:hypothetical protein